MSGIGSIGLWKILLDPKKWLLILWVHHELWVMLVDLLLMMIELVSLSHRKKVSIDFRKNTGFIFDKNSRFFFGQFIFTDGLGLWWAFLATLFSTLLFWWYFLFSHCNPHSLWYHHSVHIARKCFSRTGNILCYYLWASICNKFLD